ncbi:MAG: hypothetical protein ACLQJR_05905, partial [Stellaceae bacterium]
PDLRAAHCINPRVGTERWIQVEQRGAHNGLDINTPHVSPRMTMEGVSTNSIFATASLQPEGRGSSPGMTMHLVDFMESLH